MNVFIRRLMIAMGLICILPVAKASERKPIMTGYCLKENGNTILYKQDSSPQKIFFKQPKIDANCELGIEGKLFDTLSPDEVKAHFVNILTEKEAVEKELRAEQQKPVNNSDAVNTAAMIQGGLAALVVCVVCEELLGRRLMITGLGKVVKFLFPGKKNANNAGTLSAAQATPLAPKTAVVQRRR